MANHFYPAISEIVSFDRVPDIGNLRAKLQNFASRIFYRNLFRKISPDKSRGNYRLVLVFAPDNSNPALGFNFPADFALSINPSNVSSNIHEFPISLSYEWPILKYLESFDVDNFQEGAQEFFEIFLAISGITRRDLLEAAISVFGDPNSIDRVQDFVNSYNAVSGRTPITNINDPDELVTITNLAEQISSGEDIFKIVFQDFIHNPNFSFEEQFEAISNLFSSRLGSLDLNTIKALLVPNFYIQIDEVVIALSLPRNLFIPLDLNGNELPAPQQARVEYNVGSLGYGLKKGFIFDGDSSVNLTKCKIGGSDFTISFTGAKLDLREDYSIPEVQALGYKKDFKGIYIQEVTVGLPDFLSNASHPSNPQIFGRNIVIDFEGGGFTGTVGMDGGVLKFIFGNDLELIFEKFALSFNRNKITSPTLLNAKLIIPQFRNSSNTGPLEIVVKVQIFENGFEIRGEWNGPVLDNEKVEIKLDHITIGKQDTIWKFGFAGSLENKSEIPAVSKLFPQKLKVNNFLFKTNGDLDFDLEAIWESGLKVQGTDDTGLSIYIPVNKTIAEIFKLEAVQLNAKSENGEFVTEVQLRGASITIGDVVTGTVDGLGFAATVKRDEANGNIGPFDVDLKVVPPRGIGIKVDAKAVTGEGYLYLGDGEYIGALGLSIKMVKVNAIAIINTKLPDGSKGFSMLVIITADFTPLQIGFGFTLNGVGGLLGLHRTSKLEIIRDGLKEERLDSILFPTDIVENITRIVSDIKEIFPSRQKSFVIGPMGKFGWGTPTLININMGLIVEFGNGEAPKFAILGKVWVALPDEKSPIISLNIAFIGILDFENKYLSFDASIYDSRLLAFTLSGDMALRIFWGTQKEFLLSVGGFHPAFTPEASLQVPQLTRLTISLLSDNPSLRLSTYFAVTSNTVQFGAEALFRFKAWKVIVKGYLGFDVLFQFNPFFFTADVYAGLGVFWDDMEILGIHLAFSLSGPAPWRAKGKATFKVLCVKIPVKFDKTFGEKKDTSLPDINVYQLVKDAFANPGNWRTFTIGPPEFGVSLRKVDLPEGELLVQPKGSFEFSQKVVPLGLTLTRFGNQKPVGYNHFYISAMGILNGPTATGGNIIAKTESFAPAQFQEQSNEDKLKAKSFVDMSAGGRPGQLETEKHAGEYKPLPVTYEEIILDKPDPIIPVVIRSRDIETLSAIDLNKFVQGGTIGQSQGSRYAKLEKMGNQPLVKVNKESFKVVNNQTLTPLGAVHGTEAEALATLTRLINQNPDLEGQLQVMQGFEMEIA